jgi:acyl-CoA synthetase (AMP-forming)/AMP-acid ligase II
MRLQCCSRPPADSAQSIDLSQILAFARERLADYKVPETLKIVDKIPRNTLGKIDRQLLSAKDGRPFVPATEKRSEESVS